jgi:trimeric autotransporter adhesin
MPLDSVTATDVWSRHPQSAAHAAFHHMIDSDHDGYITQGDLLRTFGMHLDERAMERMLENIDWRANRMSFEEFQLMLSDNRKSDDERGVLEYTKALQYIAEKGAFAAKKAAAEKTTASEKAAAEKEAAEDEAAKKEAAAKAAAEKEAAEKAAAEKAVDAPVDFATPQVKVEMEEALNTPSSAAPTPRTEWLREASKALAAEKEAAERVAAHTAPVGRPPAPEGEDELFEMTVPEGVMPGDMLQATTPSGVKVRLMVPEGVSSGAVLTFKADAISPSKWAMQSPLREPPAAPAGATTDLATPAAPAEATTGLATPAAPAEATTDLATPAAPAEATTDLATPAAPAEATTDLATPAAPAEATTGLATPAAPAEATTDLATPAAPHALLQTAQTDQASPSTACETEHEAAKAEPATKAEIAAAMATLTSMANSLLMHAKFEAAKAEAVVKRQRAAVLAAAAAAEIETTLTSMTFELLGHAKSDAAAKAAALAMARAAIHNDRTPTAPGLSTVVAATSSPVKHARHNARHMTTAQLRAALRESGVDAPEGADRETLEALVTLSTDATAAATELSPPHASVRLVRSPPAGRPAAAAKAPPAAAAAGVTTAASAESAAAAATRPDRSSICILSHDPMVYVIDRFFTPDECEMIKDAAATHHKYPSRVKQPMTGLAARQQPGQMSDGRRSETTWLHYSDAVSAPEGP